ncbi:MAG: arginine--tRNA ligase [Alphaproteobacteria bacterium]|nr:arginine--tRNA ligase [Alphaproteobacteria bacterium]
MTSLVEKLSNIVGEAFTSQGFSVELGTVRVSDRPDLCQFQCNGAMAAAKKNNGAKKNPREIAQNIIDILCKRDEFSKVEIAGPGFINLDITDEYLSAYLVGSTLDKRFGVNMLFDGQTFVLDYGGPNIAKPMHVGHLRASIIGDSLRRICAFAGYNTIGDVHIGDWGTPVGMVLSELEERGIIGQFITAEDLEEIYPASAKACKEDKTRMEKARLATKKLQNGDAVYRKAWEQFVNVSIEGMKKNFDLLGVHFDEWKGEACVHDLIAPMIKTLKDKKIAEESNDAIIIPIKENSDKKEIPPLILLKSDGAVMYSTTDMGTIIDRMQTHNPVKILYCTDQRQSLHFEQLFRAAYKAKLLPETVELIFAGFGTMNGMDGKPFKTRAGGIMKLEDLISMGIEKAQFRLDEANLAKDLDKQEHKSIAHKIAISAIKFADLQNPRQSNYIFDLDRLISFEGKTGPYLLYQAVRIKSLLRKAQVQTQTQDQTQKYIADNKIDILIKDEDRTLALLLSELPDHFKIALKNYTPHVLCDYAFRLAQGFSSFYASCHILSEKNKDLRASRLALCDLTYKQLELVLDLLGIEIPDRM